MGLFDKIKKTFKADANKEEMFNNKSTESTEKNNNHEKPPTNGSPKNNDNKEFRNHNTLPKNFTYLDQLIHSGQKEIKLEYDIILEEGEEKKYPEGIRIDVDYIYN